jgi:hypothetical protein
VIVRIHDENLYSFPGWLDGVRGNFASSNGTIDFVIETNELFIGVVSFVLVPTHRFNSTVVLNHSCLAGAASGFDISLLLSRTEGFEGSIGYHRIWKSDSVELSREFTHSFLTVPSYVAGETCRSAGTSIWSESHLTDRTGGFHISPRGLLASDSLAPSRAFNFNSFVWERTFRSGATSVFSPSYVAEGTDCIGLSPYHSETEDLDGSVRLRPFSKSRSLAPSKESINSDLFCVSGPPSPRPNFRDPPTRRNRVKIID